MVVCRFFQQGSCRYGNNCRFEHVYPQKYSTSYSQQQHGGSQPSTASAVPTVTTEQMLNQVVSEANIALKSGQWLLSCYSPFRDKPNFPGFNDYSPEEVRLSTYEAKANGTLADNQNQIAKCYQEALEKFKTLAKPTAVIVRTLDALYKGQTPADPFTSSSFGSQAQSGNIFGSGQNTGNVFGATPQASGNLFNSTAANLFQSAASGMFGGGGGQFGSTNTNNFAAKQEPVNTFDNNAGFGATNNAFFGNQVNATPAFGIQANAFTNQPNNMTPFGNQTITATPFGSQPNAFNPASSPAALFGAANAAIKVEPQPIANEQIAVFGSSHFASNSVFTSNPSSGNVFGVDNSSPFANPFLASAQPEVVDERIYSKLEDLSEKDLRAFQSETFTYGLIPEVPPPMALCS